MPFNMILTGLVFASATSVSLGGPVMREHPAAMTDPCGAALPASRVLPVASGIQSYTKLATGGFVFYLNQFGAQGLDAEVELLGGKPPAGDAVATWSLALPGDKSVYVGLTHVFTHGAQQHVCVQGTAFLNLGNGSGAATAPSVAVSLDGTVSAASVRIVVRLGNVTYTLSGQPQVESESLGLPRVAVCQRPRLTITVAGSGVGLGHVGIQYRLHNASSQSCALSGYATVVLLDAARRPLPTVLNWGPGYLSGNRPVRLVTLGPGGNAYLVVEWVHNPTPGQTCPKAYNLLILPPGASSAALISTGSGYVDACGGELTVSPVEPTPFGL